MEKHEDLLKERKLELQKEKKFGQKEEKIEIAKNMLAKGLDIEVIISCTGLTKEEIEKINIDVNTKYSEIAEETLLEGKIIK